MFLYYPLPPAHPGEVEAEQDIFVDVLKSHVLCVVKFISNVKNTMASTSEIEDICGAPTLFNAGLPLGFVCM